MKNGATRHCLNEINNKSKYYRENSESLLKSKEYKGMYLVANSNTSHAQTTQKAALYVKTQGKKNLTNCQQGFAENDSFSDVLYKDKTDASFALSAQSEEVKIRTYTEIGSKDVSDDMHNMHHVSYPQNQMKYTNELDVKNALNDVMAKSVLIEEIGKKLVEFLGSAFGQKLMKEYSKGKQKSDIFSSTANLLDPKFSLDMGRIKMIIDEICNALQTQSYVKVDEESSELQQNPQEKSSINKFCSKDCLLTDRSTPPRNNTEGQYSIKKECSGVGLNKSERKIHHLNLKQSNRLNRNRYSTGNFEGKGNTEDSHKQVISVNSDEGKKRLYTSVPTSKTDCGKKSIFSTVKETFNAFLKNKLFENCFEKHISSAQNKVEHRSVKAERRPHNSGTPKRFEYSQTGAKRKNVSTLINRGSHLSSRKVIKISKQTAAGTHTKTLKKSENIAPECGLSKPRNKSKVPYSVTPRRSDKTPKWTQDDFQKLLFELLESLCSKIKKKDLQRLSVLLDILMKLQDQNLSYKLTGGKCTEMVACYNIEQHTKDYTRDSTTRRLHTVTSNKKNVHGTSTEGDQYEACKAFFETTNSNSVTKYKKRIQTNISHNNGSLTQKNSIKKQEHTKSVANINKSTAVQTKFQSKIDMLSMSNMCSNNVQLQEDLKVPLNNVVNNKNITCEDCEQFSENCSTETVVKGENQNTSNTRNLVSNCRVRQQIQYGPENHCLTTTEGKNINNFLHMIRPSDANQSHNNLNLAVMRWHGMDGKVKCPLYQRGDSYEYSYEPATNIDNSNNFVTIIGLPDAYQMYYNLTFPDLCVQTTDSKSKQVCTNVHKIAEVSSLYKHAAFRYDSSNNINGVTINIPFSNEFIFPKTTEYYKKRLKTGRTLKFYLPFEIKSNNCMELIALKSENKEARYIFENEEDKSVTGKEEINLLKEECAFENEKDKLVINNEEIDFLKDECNSERKCSPKSYFLAPDECVRLQRALLHNVLMEDSQCSEQKVTPYQSVDHRESTYNKVESDDVLHEASSILLIKSPAGKQATHTSNCFTFQCIQKPLSPWNFENQVGSLMFGAFNQRQFPVTSSLCAEDCLDSSDGHIPDLPKTNLVSPCHIKTFDIKIIRETREHDKKILNSRRSITRQLPTYFVFSAHDIKNNKEKMHRHITRKTGKRNRNIHDPQSSRSNEPRIRHNYASYYQRPSICLEPTTCTYDNLDTSPQADEKNKNIQHKIAKKYKILHYQDFHTPDSPSQLEKREPFYPSKDLKNVNIVPTESISNTEPQYPESISNTEPQYPESISNTEPQYPVKNLDKTLDTKKSFSSSSVELTDDTSEDKSHSESITTLPNQQSVESLDNDMKLNTSLSDANKVQNIDHKETEESDGLSEKEVHMPLFPSKAEEKKKPSPSVRFKSDQRVRVYPIQSSSETSEETLIKPQDRIKMLRKIDEKDMEKQAASQAATNLNNVHSHLINENGEREQNFSSSLEPQNIAEFRDLPNSSENDKQAAVLAESLSIAMKQKDSEDNDSVKTKKQKKVSKIIHKIFPNEESKDESSLGANADTQTSSTPYQYGNAEEQDKNIKQTTFTNEKTDEDAENTTTKGDSDYNKWRLSQSRRIIKTHHALIKEAHDLGETLEPGDSDGSDTEKMTTKIKIGQSTWDTCTPADFLLHFRRGFRDDQMTLNNKVCFVERLDLLSDQEGNEEMIDLMATYHPLDFLVQLGYSAEEAAIISQDEEIKSRLYAAIREARIWANAITKPQAALLYILAHKAKPKIMRYYLSLVESIINRRIMNAVKLNELMDFLECIEDGEISLKDIFDDLAENDAQEERKKTEDLYTILHHMAEEEGMNCGKYPLSAKQEYLIQTLVSKYHIALQDHLELLTRYIGRGLIKNTIQLEAALVYLPHVARNSVNIEEFEEYCGIKSKKKPNSRMMTRTSL